MLDQDSCRSSQRDHACASMANPVLVHENSTNVDTTTKAPFRNFTNGTSSASARKDTHPERKTQIDGLSFIRGYYSKQGIFEHIANVLLDSWRSGTQKQYAVYLNKCNVFCGERKIDPYSPNLNQVLDFLHTQLHLSYLSLNTARSALSCIIYIDNVPVGTHPLVCRFLKEILWYLGCADCT